MVICGGLLLLLSGLIVYQIFTEQTDSNSNEMVESTEMINGTVSDTWPEIKDETGPVSVIVQPLSLGDSGTWDFAVTLQTHSVDLGMDVLALIVLLDPSGSEMKPTKWDGDPPGGHHRTGTLSFAGLSPTPESVTILAKDIAEVPVREFRWSNK